MDNGLTLEVSDETLLSVKKFYGFPTEELTLVPDLMSQDEFDNLADNEKTVEKKLCSLAEGLTILRASFPDGSPEFKFFSNRLKRLSRGRGEVVDSLPQYLAQFGIDWREYGIAWTETARITDLSDPQCIIDPYSSKVTNDRNDLD